MFSVGEPPRDKIEGHLKICTRGKPLTIPRSATLEPHYSEGAPSIKIKWDSKQTGLSSGKRRLRTQADNANVTGVEDIALCLPDDQQYTTEVSAHYFPLAGNPSECPNLDSWLAW